MKKEKKKKKKILQSKSNLNNFQLKKIVWEPGLPDSSWYNIPKREKYTRKENKISK
jgi:hypothetical protein